MKFFLLTLKNLLRNKLRSTLTVLAVVLLVATFSMVATVLQGLSGFTAEKARDVKTILTERYRIPSRFDRSYVDQIVQPGRSLNRQLTLIPGFHREKHTVWTFIGFTLDPEMKNKDLLFFAVATIPEIIPLMMDDLEGLDP